MKPLSRCCGLGKEVDSGGASANLQWVLPIMLWLGYQQKNSSEMPPNQVAATKSRALGHRSVDDTAAARGRSIKLHKLSLWTVDLGAILVQPDSKSPQMLRGLGQRECGQNGGCGRVANTIKHCSFETNGTDVLYQYAALSAYCPESSLLATFGHTIQH